MLLTLDSLQAVSPNRLKKRKKERNERKKGLKEGRKETNLWEAEVSLVEFVYKNIQDRIGR